MRLKKGKTYAIYIFNKLIPRIPIFLRSKVCIAGSLAKTLIGVQNKEFRAESDIDIFLKPESTDEDLRLIWQRVGPYLDDHRVSPFIIREEWFEKLKDEMICGSNFRLDLRLKRIKRLRE